MHLVEPRASLWERQNSVLVGSVDCCLRDGVALMIVVAFDLWAGNNISGRRGLCPSHQPHPVGREQRLHPDKVSASGNEAIRREKAIKSFECKGSGLQVSSDGSRFKDSAAPRRKPGDGVRESPRTAHRPSLEYPEFPYSCSEELVPLLSPLDPRRHVFVGRDQADSCEFPRLAELCKSIRYKNVTEIGKFEYVCALPGGLVNNDTLK